MHLLLSLVSLAFSRIMRVKDGYSHSRHFSRNLVSEHFVDSYAICYLFFCLFQGFQWHVRYSWNQFRLHSLRFPTISPSRSLPTLVWWFPVIYIEPWRCPISCKSYLPSLRCRCVQNNCHFKGLPFQFKRILSENWQ